MGSASSFSHYGAIRGKGEIVPPFFLHSLLFPFTEKREVKNFPLFEPDDRVSSDVTLSFSFFRVFLFPLAR